jgi:hypothetical protein
MTGLFVRHLMTPAWSSSHRSSPIVHDGIYNTNAVMTTKDRMASPIIHSRNRTTPNVLLPGSKSKIIFKPAKISKINGIPITRKNPAEAINAIQLVEKNASTVCGKENTQRSKGTNNCRGMANIVAMSVIRSTIPAKANAMPTMVTMKRKKYPRMLKMASKNDSKPLRGSLLSFFF